MTTSPNIITDNLILYLDTGNLKGYPGTGTTITDLSGRGNNATLTNSPTFTTNSKGYLQFDGTNDYLDLPGFDLSWNNSNSITISMYLKPNTLSQYRPFIGKGPSGWEWELIQVNSDLKLVYWNTGGGHTNGPIETITDFFINTTEFVYLVVTWNHVDNKHYVWRNGQLVKTINWVDASINQNRTDGIKIGGAIYQWDATGQYWAGAIAHVMVYQKALNALEIQQNYLATVSRFKDIPNIVTSGLKLHLDAGDPNSILPGSTIWRDLSGTGNNGTLLNGPSLRGENGGSLKFDGVNDWVNLGNPSSLNFNNSTFSYGCWFFWDNQAGYLGLLGKRDGPATSYSQYTLAISETLCCGPAGKKIGGYLACDGGAVATGNLITDLPNSIGWQYAFITVNTTEQKLYLNGELKVTTTANFTGRTFNITGKSLIVGAITADTEGGTPLLFYNNRIAQVKVYDRTLSASEVLQNYNATKLRFGVT